MKGMFSLLLFFALSFASFSQNNLQIIDSLKQIVSKNPHDSLKIKAYSDLCWYYRDVSIDTAFIYGNKALNLSKKTKNKGGEAQAYNDLGILYYDTSNFTKSVAYYHKTRVYREFIKDSMGVAGVYNKLGISYQRLFNMDSAIFYATKALKIYEAKRHIQYAAVIKNNIANIYQNLKLYDKALESHLEIAKTYKKINDLEGLTNSYTNIGNAYLLLKDTLKSLDYYHKGAEIASKQHLKRELATIYNNIGSIYKGQKKYNQAIDLYNKSFNLRTTLDDHYGMASAAINLGNLYISNGDLNKVEEKLRLGLGLAKKANAKELEKNAYGTFLSYYAYKKNTDSIINYQNLFNTIQDTILNERITKEIFEIQEKYDASEREKEILTQRAEIAEQELDLSKKNSQLKSLIVLALLISLFGYLLYNQQKIKNKQLQKENELKEALAKIETQNRLQEQRLAISRDLHDNIGAQLTFIISAIENLQYGFNITNQKLNTKLLGISQFTKETIYELRDTIWAMNKNEITLEDLQTRISNFMEKGKLSTSSVKFNFIVDPNLSIKMALTSFIGMNLYRIVQEAINNAMKYAEASQISVYFEKTSSNLEVSITDNGKGFNLDEIELGNGINNMKKRAADINANIDINSTINSGATIKLTLPV